MRFVHFPTCQVLTGRFGRLLEASSLIDDVFASALADKINPAAAIVLAHAAAASPAATTGAVIQHNPRLEPRLQ